MRLGRNGFASHRALIAHLDGQATAGEERDVARALAGSADARARAAQLTQLMAELGWADADLVQADVWPRLAPALARLDAEGSAADPGNRAPRRWLLPAGALGALSVAAACVLVLVSVQDRGPRESDRSALGGPASAADPGFRPKSTGAAHERRTWAGVEVYRVAAGAQRSRAAAPLRVEGVLHTGDGLLFSYTNLGPRPFGYLMIFVTDSTGRIYWYHPAFVSAAEDPTSIAIAKRSGDQELRELIHQPLPLGRIRLHGLFSDEPLAVRAIEARNAAQTAAHNADLRAAASRPLTADALGAPDALLTVRELEVRP